ncbi:MAG TPA: Ig-like domain-containing protein, partial [Bacteroidota bacterium]|nr:Ig-like domain-containing protein [Bacteroidota bacterium]
MNKYINLGYTMMVLFMLNSCSKESPPSDSNTTKPIVRILSPANNSLIIDSTIVEVEALDDVAIAKVEIYIDDRTFPSKVFLEKPYRWTWLLQAMEDSSIHSIYAKAYDIDGNEASSGISTVTIMKFAPSDLRIISMDESSVTLQWRDNGRLETGFVIEQSVDGSHFVSVDSVSANVTNSELQGVFYTTSIYLFRVRAKSDESYSIYSNIVLARLTFPAPSNLIVVFMTQSSISLRWRDNSTFEIGFEIEQSTDGMNFSLTATVDSNVISASIPGVYGLTEVYYFRVRAKGITNVSNYSNVAVGSLALPPPTNLIVTFISQSGVTLEWQDNSSTEISFEIETSEDGSHFSVLQQVDMNINSVFIRGEYLPTRSYYFRVRAIAPSDTSPYSNRVRVYFGEELYAGGQFTNAGGMNASYIAKWSGSSWSSLWTGVDNPVYSLIVYNNKLYAGGLFTNAGYVTANYIAQWNGSSWSVLADGMNDYVYALAVYNNELYAGGDFTAAGGVNVNHIARWNGTRWLNLGLGLDGYVFALIVFNNELYAGGMFNMAGDVNSFNVARWNGTTWNDVGGGVNDQVYAFAVYDDEL